MGFKDKVVLVTGASQNTGVEIAERFLKEGAKVAINSNNDVDLAKVQKSLAKSYTDRIIDVIADISQEVEVRKMFERIDEYFGRIDIVVNNACDLGIGPSFDKVLPTDFMRVISVNLIGTFLVSSYAVNRMLVQDTRGVIVNISSNVTERAIHNRVGYVASKSGVDGLTKAMAIDLGRKGIRVNSVAPGYIYSNRWLSLSEQDKARRRLNVPIGTESTGDDIADAVLFLASPKASTINGARLVVDGGCSAQHLPVDVDL